MTEELHPPEELRIVKTSALPAWSDKVHDMILVLAQSTDVNAVEEMAKSFHSMAQMADERNAMLNTGFPPRAVRQLDDVDLRLLVASLRFAAVAVAVQPGSVDRMASALGALANMIERYEV
jgi:hypothetical protein